MKQDLQLIRLGIAGWLFFALVQSTAANEVFEFAPSHSTIGFRVHQFLGGTSGRFTRFSGSIVIDRQNPENSSVSASIEVSSIDTGNKKRDDHLRSEEFFNVARYPAITFKSRSARQTGPDRGEIVGDLTMHGVTRAVTLHVRLTTPLKDEASLQRTHWEVTVDPLKRRDFDLTFGKAAEAVSGIGQKVAIKIEIEAAKAH